MKQRVSGSIPAWLFTLFHSVDFDKSSKANIATARAMISDTVKKLPKAQNPELIVVETDIPTDIVNMLNSVDYHRGALEVESYKGIMETWANLFLKKK